MDDKVKDLIMSLASKLSESTNAILDEFIPLASKIGDPIKIFAHANVRSGSLIYCHIVNLIIKHKLGRDFDQVPEEEFIKICKNTKATLNTESSRAFEEIYKEFMAQEDKSSKNPITAEVIH